jgi:hypothetical protein
MDQVVKEIKSQANATISNIRAVNQPDSTEGDEEPEEDGELISPASP